MVRCDLDIQNRIKKRIKQFDICSLRRLLHDLGYKAEDIFYYSNSDQSSRSTLCEDIYFSNETSKVTISLNLGLLSANSPLPNLFRKKMDAESIDSVLFTRFIRFFDHHIIQNLLSMSMPEMENNFLSNWREMQKYYLKMLDLTSTSTLWHAVQCCFPELIVKVIKSPLLMNEKSSSLMLGYSRLGTNSFLGKKIEQAIPSFKIALIGEETVTDQLIPWPLEVKKRLKNMMQVLLKGTSIHFRVFLMITNNRDIAKLSPTSHLGYCRIGENNLPLNLLLFSGYASELDKLSPN